MTSSMRLIFLGTGGCVPTETRNLPSLYLEFLGEPFLFDVGEGTQRQMRKAGLNFMKLDHIFLTHLHADHFLGIGGMIQSMDFLERDRELTIHGPAGTKNAINTLLSAGTFQLKNFKLNLHEVEPGPVCEGKNYTVTCAKTIHTANSLAYCFEEKPYRRFLKKKALEMGIPEGRLFGRLQRGQEVELDGSTIKPEEVLDDPIPGRKIIVSGDTRPCGNVIRLAKDADILVHEASFSGEDAEQTKDAAHTTIPEAAEIAAKANAKKLYLTHISQRYSETEKLEAEAREKFTESYIAEDFMEVDVPKHW
ncbi:MAG: ribonuclease Z [Candidatus Altiarchaeota archaeon]